MRQLPLALAPRPQPTLHNYLPGPNRAAVSHLMALAGGDAPVYLWGPSGCGKTHLLRGLADRLAPAEGVAWIGSDWAAERADWCDRWRLVLLDDAQALPSAAQHAAFALFNEAAARGVPFVAAGTVPPVDLPVREDLRTRLGWGDVLALEPLDDAGKRQAVREEAARRGLPIGDDVLSWVLTRFPRDLGTLIPLLDTLDDYGLAKARPLTVPLLRRMVDEGVVDPTLPLSGARDEAPPDKPPGAGQAEACA